MKLLSIFCLLSFNFMANAFSVRTNVPALKLATAASHSMQISNIGSSTRLYSSNDDEITDTVTSTPAAPVTIKEPEKDYPLDIPSAVLLSSSMVLAIATTGSIFELSGGAPVLGVIPSVGIIVTGLPLCLFLFYAAIKKGIAETDEDDKKFQQRTNRF